MMKDFIGLTLEEAMVEAQAQGRSYEVKTEHYEFDGTTETYMIVSTSEGNGACLYFEDGKVEEYAFCDWV